MVGYLNNLDWLPNQEQFVFTCTDEQSLVHICLVDQNGKLIDRISFVEKATQPDFRSPIVWLPDGETLLFQAEENDDFTVFLYTYNLHTENLKQVASLNSQQGNLSDIERSPDAKQMVLSLEGQLSLMNIEDWSITYLTEGIAPAWSPNASQIAFITWRDSNEDNIYFKSWTGEEIKITRLSGIYVMATDGTALELVYEDPSREICPRELDWSPDGLSLSFLSSCGEGDPTKLYILNIETHQLELIIEDLNSLAPYTISWSKIP